ncbi:hypothetical protein PV328_005008 [Microctonus aethiopoides]|uniref:DNA polymerase n=1 Tax=Microctonus aethiopoides TaxID=144406 RepID=A0AA39KRZ7_9HYME|nr:hypothetical protein PV328_005008 [Microctonus aethiopoides]
MDEDIPSTSRQKRQKLDKSGRFAALQKLKQLKGSKHKYEIEKIENVYDEVDEKEYMKTVSERQNSDWIVDDGGSGYVEDGREIFDDDLDDESIQKASKQKLIGPRKRKRDEGQKSKSTIINMLQHASVKKKAEGEPNADDQLLADMLSKIKDQKTCNSGISATSNKFKVAPKPHAPSRDIFSLGSEKYDESLSVDDLSIFDPLSPPPKSIENSNNKTQKCNVESQNSIKKIDENNASNIELKSNNKKILSQEIDLDCSQYHEDFDEEFTIDNISTPSSSLITTKTNTNIAIVDTKSNTDSGKDINNIESMKTTKSLNASIIEDDDFDAIIGSMDEKNFNATNNLSKDETLKYPTIDETNFEEVIASLEKEAPWSEYEKDLTQLSKIDCETMQTIRNNNDLSSSMVKNNAGNSVIRFYWWDAVENPYKMPGVVNLLGKVYFQPAKRYISCCLSIKNVPRRIYLLPKEKIQDEGGLRPTTMTDVYNEFNELTKKYNISEFRSAIVTKSYAFDRAGTPFNSEYLEVKYPSTAPALDPSYSGPAIEHIFGTSVTALELLLMERDIRGPSWLEIESPIQVASSISWCPLQINCLKMENISVYKDDDKKLPIPSMVIATIIVRTTLNSRTNDTEIAMIGVLINNKYHVDKQSPTTKFQQHYCFVTHPKDTPWPLYARDQLPKCETTVIVCETESDLLAKFLDTIQQIDPDLLIGYDCGFQFDIIYRRLMFLRVRNWSRTGKLKQTTPASSSKVPLSWIFNGRPICDLLTSVKELNIKVRSYDLDSICQAVLKTNANTIKEIKPVDCPQFYTTIDKIKTLIKVTMSEALYITKLLYELNVVPLALQITCIAGNILSRTLSAGRAERNEYLLLHAFSKKGYITPDKPSKSKSETKGIKKKAAYAGGLVLDPKRGFYDKLILLMDFNSLYPSIIHEYNLCFTTIPGVCYSDAEELVLPRKDIEIGIVPTEIRKLVESRREVKNLMKRPNLSGELKMQYNIRQLALKLTANSMYGCFGATHCRFYAKGLAALVTSKGREILTHTKALVEALNYEVIYGDTDSLMINSNTLNYDEAFDIAKTIKQEVNKRYKTLELDIDGVFRYLLLLHKKKYAAVLMKKLSDNVKFEYITEYKGLDIVRRDWCHLASEMGRTILNLIFVDSPDEDKLLKIKDKLSEVAMAVRKNQLPISSYIITKQLSKNPNEYPDKKQSHVAIALRLNKSGGRMWKSGDTISYVICLDGTDRNAPERTYHIDEFKKRDDLKIDCNYYLLNQIFPVIYRICEPIETITDMFLAESLDLKDIYKPRAITLIDTNKIQQTSKTSKSMAEKDNYKNCMPFTFECSMCKAIIEIKGFFMENEETGKKPALLNCTNLQCNFPLYKNLTILQNTLQLNLRAITKKYYQQKFICTNSKCRKIQKGVILSGWRGIPQCRKCKIGYLVKPYKDSQCWNQINFYRHIFDMSQYTSSIIGDSHPPEMLSVYDTLKELVEMYLKRNRFSLIDFASIYLMLSKKCPKIKGIHNTTKNSADKTKNNGNLRKKGNSDRIINYVGKENLEKWHEILMNENKIKIENWSIG